MKLQKTTLIWLIFALVLGSFVYFNQIKYSQESASIQNEKRKIFNFKEEDIQQLIIETEGETLKFERTNDRQSNWQIKQPKDVPANNGVVAFLLNLLVQEKSDRTFTVSIDNLNRYDLQPPRGIITIILNNLEKYQLILGKSDFENKFIYARVDPIDSGNKNVNIVLVSKNFHYAVLERSLEDWKKLEDKKNTGS